MSLVPDTNPFGRSDRLQESCAFPNCATVKRLKLVVQNYAKVATAADALMHTIYDRKNVAEFNKAVEALRQALCNAGYGGAEVQP